MESGTLEPQSRYLVEASVRTVGNFLIDLESVLYQDARDLYENHAQSTRTRDLLDPARMPIDFLKKALDTVTPAKGQDPQNPTLFYFLQRFIEERTQSPTVSQVVVETCAAGPKNCVAVSKTLQFPRRESDFGDAITRAVSDIYITMASVAEIPPCANPGAGSVAAKGRPGYRLNGGNLKGLADAFLGRTR